MQLVWFRQDLRLIDHPALRRACHEAKHSGEPVEAVFIISRAQWQKHHMAPLRERFWLERVNVLGGELARLGIRLHLLEVPWFTDIPAALHQLVISRGATALHAINAIEIDERRRDEAVAATLPISCHFVPGCCVFAPGSILTGKGEPFKVFTPFCRAWTKRLSSEGFSLHRAPAAVGEPVAWNPLVLAPLNEAEAAALADWPVSEGAGEARLGEFISGDLAEYGELRDLPAQAGTSRLSAYLAAGILSPRQCLAALHQQLGALPLERGQPGFVWLNELVWREFYRHLLVLEPRLSMDQPFQRHTRQLAWRFDEQAFSAWCEGRTGFPVVDAAMRCLNQTGWMHNRLRMIVASFLTKDLHISWRLGEDYFMSRLIDGDLAANNGGWQWSAGTGADAAPYFRVFNPTTQGQKFDPQGDFIRTWVTELADVPAAYIHEPHDWLRLKGRHDYPAPIVDHALARQYAIAMFKQLEP
ncbi:deoxyribodipyrimidine photo-lyase [Aeromonas sp. RU39B]|uniref:deoxyribodipyrimidine photo-lyase n=1 Tax=Aeromonas sp. RU39B TaxID=1907416 RepID=UPI0009569338|nr:deoxyribodipyrimidine photo-lyase [Aeromonas sp. RU39B]SIQ86873.1 deoxyribodipyrimidine photo-lyase [Aeromonas sp. RU39B]